MYRREYVSHLMTAKANNTNTNTKLKEFEYWWDVIVWFWQWWMSRTTRSVEREWFNFFTESFACNNETLDTISYELSKYGIIEEPISLPANNFTIEIATKGNDEVEFGWFMVVFSDKDVIENRIENVWTVGDIELSKYVLQ